MVACAVITGSVRTRLTRFVIGFARRLPSLNYCQPPVLYLIAFGNWQLGSSNVEYRPKIMILVTDRSSKVQYEGL